VLHARLQLVAVDWLQTDQLLLLLLLLLLCGHHKADEKDDREKTEMWLVPVSLSGRLRARKLLINR